MTEAQRGRGKQVKATQLQQESNTRLVVSDCSLRRLTARPPAHSVASGTLVNLYELLFHGKLELKASISKKKVIKRTQGARGLAQLLRVLGDLAEDLSSVPRSHNWQLTAACNSSSKGSDTFFQPLQAPTYTETNRWTDRQKHTHLNK